MLVRLIHQVLKPELKRRFLKPLVKAMLASPQQAAAYSCESDFQKLQAAYPPYPEYGYDSLSTWRRAAQRVIYLLEKTAASQPGLRILDAACGDGMLGVLLDSYGHHPTLVDASDWRDPRARGLPFWRQPLEDMEQLPSGQFDLVCSYNSFEHLADPGAAFNELLRVCKPGGSIFLDFGPLYHGPWGLHAYRTLRMPYPQFLFSEQFIASQLQELGIRDLGQARTELQPLNRWRYVDFVALWQEHPGCQVMFQNRSRIEAHLDIILKHPGAFKGRGLSYLELTTQGIQVWLKKC